MSAGAAATGARSYIAARPPRWMGAAGLRMLTAVIVLAGLLAAATLS